MMAMVIYNNKPAFIIFMLTILLLISGSNIGNVLAKDSSSSDGATSINSSSSLGMLGIG